MLSGTTAEVFYSGNGSTSVSYPVPFTYLAASHVKLSVIAQGTGTVTIVDGVATFSSAQATLLAGNHIRIAGITYTILSRVSDTVFGMVDHTLDVASTTFHLPDTQNNAYVFTLTETGSGAPYITTADAIPATSLVRIYREVPLTQLRTFPQTGPLTTVEVEYGLDQAFMALQQINTQLQNVGVIAVPGGVEAQIRYTNATLLAGETEVGISLDTGETVLGVLPSRSNEGIVYLGQSASNPATLEFAAAPAANLVCRVLILAVEEQALFFRDDTVVLLAGTTTVAVPLFAGEYIINAVLATSTEGIVCFGPTVGDASTLEFSAAPSANVTVVVLIHL